MDLYSTLPSKSVLLKWYAQNGKDILFSVNAHLHTPYSFSAFESIAQATDLAKAENVRVVGINDFYSTDGYKDWAEACSAKKLFPLFNIEYISLNKEDQVAGLRVNDPSNPGRTYLSGKGLAFPPKMDEPYLSTLNGVKKESNSHVAQMCSKLNELFLRVGVPSALDFADIQLKWTKGMVRERHLAKAVREKIDSLFGNPEEKKSFYEKLFSGKKLIADLSSPATIENEIRNNLLKAGGAAFIPEPPAAFLDSDLVCQMIRNSGGIPTYPFLADDSNGHFTTFENSKEEALKVLKARNIWSVEFITTRNSLEVLEDYVSFFYNAGLVVTLGSEHNTPAMEPIELFARKKTELSEILRKINYQSACVIAAHQYLQSKEGTGYLDSNGKAKMDEREAFITLGKAIIEYQIQN